MLKNYGSRHFALYIFSSWDNDNLQLLICNL